MESPCRPRQSLSAGACLPHLPSRLPRLAPGWSPHRALDSVLAPGADMGWGSLESAWSAVTTAAVRGQWGTSPRVTASPFPAVLPWVPSPGKAGSHQAALPITASRGGPGGSDATLRLHPKPGVQGQLPSLNQGTRTRWLSLTQGQMEGVGMASKRGVPAWQRSPRDGGRTSVPAKAEGLAAADRGARQATA